MRGQGKGVSEETEAARDKHVGRDCPGVGDRPRYGFRRVASVVDPHVPQGIAGVVERAAELVAVDIATHERMAAQDGVNAVDPLILVLRGGNKMRNEGSYRG